MAKLKIEDLKAVFHIAAQSSGQVSAEEPELEIRSNVLGTKNT